MPAKKLPTEAFIITRRPGWGASLTVEITCAPDATVSIKLGLAIRAALASKIEGALRGAYLGGAYLGGAYLGGADLRGAYLRGAYLGGADLGGAYLNGADLRGADLRGAYLRGAYLRGADLRGAYLGGAYLGGAYLNGADLRGADLGGTDLGGTYLSGAYLGGAYLGGAYLREKITRVFATVSRLDGYTFMGAELETGGWKIAAGCRWFTSDEYAAHVASEYPDTDKARETLAIIDYLDMRARQVGAAKAIEAPAVDGAQR